MADETKRTPVQEHGQEPRQPEPQDDDQEPIDLPSREAMSIIGPDVPVGGVTLYPGLNGESLRRPMPESGDITTPGGIPTE